MVKNPLIIMVPIYGTCYPMKWKQYQAWVHSKHYLTYENTQPVNVIYVKLHFNC